MGVGDLTASATSIAGWLVGITLFLRALWRRMSRDKVENATDRAERGFLMRLENEARLMRERADRAYEERNEAIQALGEAVAEVRMLRARVTELTVELHRTNDRLDEALRLRGDARDARGI